MKFEGPVQREIACIYPVLDVELRCVYILFTCADRLHDSHISTDCHSHWCHLLSYRGKFYEGFF